MTMTNSPEAIAQEIIVLARNELLVNFRFLDRALVLLELQESRDTSILTDGCKLYYDPWFVHQRYKQDKNAVTRSYLHLILHLVFRHGFIGKGMNERLWSLACDMAVENIIRDMNEGILITKAGVEQEPILKELKKKIGPDKPFSAERIYDLLEKENLDDEKLDEWKVLFFGDSHALWYNGEETVFSTDIDLQVKWKDISRRMQVELELLDKDRAKLLATQLRNVNKVHQSYDELLRRFSVCSEVLKISEEEFDNNYYSYGLSLYGDMPIVEPLEYSSGHKIKDFVIAIDTSGSVNQEVAEKFLAHTYSILSAENKFDFHARLHIIQCDDRIRSDYVVSSKEEMDRYLNNIEILGRGETDFRPVFTYVDKLKKEGVLPELRGLIYFTDGDGIYPEQVSAYNTAFIIHKKDSIVSAAVPLWAVRVEMEDEDILNDNFGK